ELLTEVLKAYRSALQGVGKNGSQIAPAVGAELQKKLDELAAGLEGTPKTSVVKDTHSQVEQQLTKWGERGSEYIKAKANEVKELLIVLARTAESVGERDQRYAKRFTELTTQLQGIANLEDLAQVRTSLVSRATELKGYVEKMAEESKASVAQL